jgi:hypothetical protein
MNTRSRPKRVPTRFGSQARLNLEPRIVAAAHDETHARFEQLKRELLKPVVSETPEAALRRQLRLAANEAAAVAWTTPFPALFLPVLLEEKVAEVHQYTARQASVQEASQSLVA